MEGQMAKQVNAAGVSNANARIAAGDVVDQPWSFSAADGNAMLGANGDDWAEYGRWHLATNPAEPEKTKAHYVY
jgi:hypothetical protein